ncbi:MAG: YqhA family protein [Alphaproteobacteria bacterium]
MTDWRKIERRLLSGTRLVSLVAVISSFAGSLLMFWLGLVSTWHAYTTQFADPGGPLPTDVLTVIHLIGALDHFLIAIVLMFFGYGIHVLFVRPEATPAQLGMPRWLHVESIDQLKQTIAEVIIIVLFVLFLRVALETFGAGPPGFGWKEALGFLVLPVAIVLLAAGLKMAELYPKPPPRGRPPEPAAEKGADAHLPADARERAPGPDARP